MKKNDDLKLLEISRRISDRYLIDGGDMKPCVARMLDSSADSPFIKKPHVAFVVAMDLKFVGLMEKDVREILVESKVAKNNKIDEAIRSARNDKYKRWTCVSKTMSFELGQVRDYYCIGKEICYWYKNNVAAKGKAQGSEDTTFEKYGWHHVCSPYEHLAYLKLRELEKIRGFKPGGLIVITHDQLAFEIGCSRRHIKNTLTGLVDKRLIKYRVGDSTRREKRASRIKRIFPIPEPDIKYDRKLIEFEQYRRFGRID